MISDIHQSVILLVDDQPDNMDTMMGFLAESEYKYKFLQALNGEIACKVAEKRQPDLIIMDWEMPVMSGYDALLHLKKNPATADIPIVMATGRSSGGDLEKALNAGAADYIRKPIEKLELLARVRTCLRLAKFVSEIKIKNEHLIDLNREKDGMMDVVAHDLKSPLNNVEGLVGLLPLEGSLTNEQQQYIDQIKKQIHAGKNLINDLLDIHAYGHEDATANFSDLSLNAYFSDLITGYKEVLAKKDQQLITDFKNGDLTLSTDKNILRRIVDNLLTNAMKFSSNDTTITLQCNRQGDWIRIVVIDQGPGISDEDQKKMFKMFQKLSARPTGGESSNGLGLSIIKTLTNKLKGTIEVKSKLGVGTEFIISLPASMM
jgi:signal transduction histidine kinase